MRYARLVPVALSSFFIVASLNAQQAQTTTPRDPTAVSLLQRSFVALTGTNAVNDVTLSGTANWIAGSDDETGTATLKATAIGQSRIDLDLSNGQRSEVHDITASPSTGSWSGPDGTWHSIADHNLMTDPVWFLPEFLIGRVLTNGGYAISPVDSESPHGVSEQHLGVFQQKDASVTLPALIQSLSHMDIYLDSTSFLPAAVAFNAHPDNDAATNIRVEIKFSNYESVQGVMIPSHIQKYINNGLVLDLTISSAQINSGLSTSDFQAH